MTNDTTTTGYITPAAPVDVNDSALDDLFQEMVVGTTGLSPQVVFPRFQDEPPNLPKYGIAWAAVGVMDITPDTYVATQHDPMGADGLGEDIVYRQQKLDVLVSFYGPSAQALADQCAVALQIAQNREPLAAHGIFFTTSKPPFKAPAMLKNRWTNKMDLHLFFTRQVTYRYGVRNLLSASGQIITNDVQTEFHSQESP